MISKRMPTRFSSRIIYLQSMLSTTYFGEKADVFLCTADGEVIANSNNDSYDRNLVAILTESHMIDEKTAAKVNDVFKDDRDDNFFFIVNWAVKTYHSFIKKMRFKYNVKVSASFDAVLIEDSVCHICGPSI